MLSRIRSTKGFELRLLAAKQSRMACSSSMVLALDNIDHATDEGRLPRLAFRRRLDPCLALPLCFFLIRHCVLSQEASAPKKDRANGSATTRVLTRACASTF